MDKPEIAAAAAAHAWWLSPESAQSALSPSQKAVELVLTPLRRQHCSVRYTDNRRCCVSCFDASGRPAIWPCPVAVHLYAEEELANATWEKFGLIGLDIARGSTP